LEELQAWTQRFVRWYNQDHKHSGLKFVTPRSATAVKLGHFGAPWAGLRRGQKPEPAALVAGYQELETGKIKSG
jgi:hypothetical protein